MFSLRKPGAPLAALLMAGLLVAPGVALGGKVYIWTDEKGEKHITDKPPAQAPADMKSLSATPNEGRPAAPDAPDASGYAIPDMSGALQGGAGGQPLIPLVDFDGQPALGPDGQPLHLVKPGDPLVGPDGLPVPGADGQPMIPTVKPGDPRVLEREALEKRLEELQKEKDIYDLANRRSRSMGDGYTKQRSRYYQNEVQGRIDEVESRLKLLTPEGGDATATGGTAGGGDQ